MRSNSRGTALITLAYFSSVGVIGLVSGIIGPTLNGLASQTGVALTTIGLVVTTRSLGYLLGAVWCGGWIDGRTAHRLLSFTLVVSTASLALIPLTQSLPFLLGIMTVLGITLGALDVAGNALIFRVHRERSAPYINALHFFFGLGGLIAPFLAAGAVSVFGDISWAFWILAIVPIPFAAILLLTPTPPYLSDHDSGGSPQAKPPLTIAFLFAASLYLFYVGGQIGFVSWFYVYVESHADARTATWALGGFWAAFSLFRLLGVAISRRWSPERILIIDYSVLILSALPMLLWPQSMAGLWFGAIGMGSAHASIYATSILFLGKRFTLAGKQMSAIVVLACAGNMIFPWLMGRLFSVQRTWVIPGISTLLMVIALAITLTTMMQQTQTPVSDSSA